MSTRLSAEERKERSDVFHTRTFRCPECGYVEDFYFYTATNSHLVPACPKDESMMEQIDARETP